MRSRRLSTGWDSRIGNPGESSNPMAHVHNLVFTVPIDMLEAGTFASGASDPQDWCSHPLRSSFRSQTEHLRRRCSCGRTAQRRFFRGALQVFNETSSRSLSSRACCRVRADTFQIVETHLRV